MALWPKCFSCFFWSLLPTPKTPKVTCWSWTYHLFNESFLAVFVLVFSHISHGRRFHSIQFLMAHRESSLRPSTIGSSLHGGECVEGGYQGEASSVKSCHSNRWFCGNVHGGEFLCKALSFLMCIMQFPYQFVMQIMCLTKFIIFDVDKLPLTMCLLSVSQEEILLRRKAGSLPPAYHDANGPKSKRDARKKRRFQPSRLWRPSINEKTCKACRLTGRGCGTCFGGLTTEACWLCPFSWAKMISDCSPSEVCYTAKTIFPKEKGIYGT